MKKWMISMLLCMVMILGVVSDTVFATESDGAQTELDVSKGNIVIGNGTLEAYGTDGTPVTAADPDGYIITGTTTSNTVKFTGGSHSVYVRELNINATYAAFYIENAHVDLLLVTDCTLDSGNGYYDLHLEGTNASVKINGNGTLYAGFIGGNNGGTITIEGGGFDFDRVYTGGIGTITIKGGIYKYGYPDENCVGMQKVPVAERYKVIEDPTRNWCYEVVHGGYNISFHAGDGGNGKMEPLTGVSGSYTLPKCTFTPPVGKVFAGWSTTENGAVITERNNTMDQDYTFYAQWVDISDAGIAIDGANFPDATFRSYVATNFDINQNGYLPDTDISAATEINVMGQSITSLTGVEHFTALTKLRCDTNQLTSLDISKNKRLLELDCGANNLTSLDVSNNTLLTRLTCDANKLTALNVGNNTQLGELECSYNELTVLDVSRNTVLTYLGCNANELTTLDISNNTGLVQLECSNNQLTSLDLSMNPQLATLFCSSNAYLISVDADRTYDLTNLPGAFDVTKASNWVGGTVEGAILTVEPNTTSVTYNYANVFNDSVIFTLNVLDTSISGVMIDETNFPDAVFREYIGTQFDTNNDSNLSEEEINAVTKIGVTRKAITSLQGVEYFTALTELVCDNCQLTSLDVSKNIALQKLSCVENQIISLDVSSNINLAQLVCSNNQLTSLNVKDDVLLICQGNNYAITVDSANRTFDLTNLPGDFDAAKASNWSGGTVEGNILTVNSGTSQITYIYACGGTYIGQDNGVFTLDITEGTTYTVTLKANGGTEDDIVKTDMVGNYNLPACTFTAPTGKQFKGWSTSTSGDVITTETINVTKNIILYAIWEDIPVTEYDITVMNGTATIGAGSPITKAAEGTVITITAETAPDGQQFKEWQVVSGNATLEDSEKEETKFTMPANAVEVKAVYEDIYAVSFHANGINTNTTSETMAKESAVASKAYTLPACGFTEDENKAFVGWAYTADGSAITDKNISVTGNIELFAIWESVLPINETNFPDANFRSYVESALNTNGRKGMTDAEIAAVKEIDVSNKGISVLTGVELFTALEKLNCADNSLTALDVSANPALTDLDCSGNQLTSLDVSKNIALAALNTGGNPLGSLNVSANTALTELYCFDNNLTALDISKNTELVNLQCHNNAITVLDVSKNTKLNTLYCHGTALMYLDLTNTQVASGVTLPAGTPISSTITIDGEQKFNLPSGFDSSKVSNLIGGTISGNILTVDDEVAEVSYDYDCGNSVTVKFVLTISNPSVSGVIINEQNFPDEYFRTIVSEDFDTDQNGILSDTEIAAAESVTINDKNTKTLKGVEFLTELTSLDCSNFVDSSGNVGSIANKLTSLDLSKNTKLYKLICSGNQLTSLDLSAITGIIYQFECTDNIYNITVDTDRTFDLTNLPGSFDVTKASNWNGGTVSGTTLTVDAGVTKVTYTYDCGKDKTAVFTLKVTEGATYTVTVTANGGTGNDIVKNAVAGYYKLPDCTFTAPVGKQFKGWAVIATGNVITTNTINVTSDITLYAIWEDIEATITSVEITPDTANVQKGTTQQFTATVYGTGNYNRDVTWSIEEADSGATISAVGLLNIASDSDATELTITATAKGDPTKSATASVTVTEIPVTTYALTVKNGTGDGNYEEDAVVTITADEPAAGKKFKVWSSSNALEFVDGTDEQDAVAKIQMPAESVTVTAVYEDQPKQDTEDEDTSDDDLEGDNGDDESDTDNEDDTDNGNDSEDNDNDYDYGHDDDDDTSGSSAGSASSVPIIAKPVVMPDSYTGSEWTQNAEGTWYLTRAGGINVTGWAVKDNEWYYMDETTGEMQTGWEWIDDQWYYLSDSGAMETSWIHTGNAWYYLHPTNGEMLTDWQFVNGRWYYLDPFNGDMKTDWQLIGGRWYYLDPANGHMLIGWQRIGGLYYYMTANGDMLANTMTPDGYWVDESGKWIP